jgi:hypothetical protein
MHFLQKPLLHLAHSYFHSTGPILSEFEQPSHVGALIFPYQKLVRGKVSEWWEAPGFCVCNSRKKHKLRRKKQRGRAKQEEKTTATDIF